jgi:hypothetical protein
LHPLPLASVASISIIAGLRIEPIAALAGGPGAVLCQGARP